MFKTKAAAFTLDEHAQCQSTVLASHWCEHSVLALIWVHKGSLRAGAERGRGLGGRGKGRVIGD